MIIFIYFYFVAARMAVNNSVLIDKPTSNSHCLFLLHCMHTLICDFYWCILLSAKNISILWRDNKVIIIIIKVTSSRTQLNRFSFVVVEYGRWYNSWSREHFVLLVMSNIHVCTHSNAWKYIRSIYSRSILSSEGVRGFVHTCVHFSICYYKTQ